MPGQVLSGVEIFAIGVHHASSGGRVEITEQDLDDMVASFKDLNDFGGFKPVLKLGHTETQKFFGNISGAPNLGFVENVRRIGNTIVADFVNVPQLLFDLIKDGRYNQVSIEMMRTVDVVGKKFKNVLTAVALLGAEMPAVKGLNELAKALMADAALNQVTCGNLEGDRIELTSMEADMPEGTTYNQEQHDALVQKAVSEAVAAATAKFTEEKDATKAELTKVKGERDGLRQALHTFKTDQVATELKTIVDDAVKAGKVLPKQRDSLIEMGAAMASLEKFGSGEKDGLTGFKDHVNALPKVVEFGEKGEADGDSPNDQTFDNEGDRVDALVRKHMADEKSEDYAASYAHVIQNLKPAQLAAYAGA